MSKEDLNDLFNDPNYPVFKEAEANGLFSDLEPGTFVAYVDGVLVAIEADIETIIKKTDLPKSDNLFIEQVNLPLPSNKS